jgi:hypothetical protein
VTESPRPRGTEDLDALLPKLRDLVDRAEILECLHRYTRGMDRMDRELARSAYHDDAIDVHRDLVMTADELVDWAFAYHAEQSGHQHIITNHTIELDGDTAHGETYYVFVGTFPDRETPMTVAGGRYLDRFERRDGRWAIAARVCTLEWVTRPLSKQRGAPVDDSALVEPFTVSRDRTDVSYQRPMTLRAAPSG